MVARGSYLVPGAVAPGILSSAGFGSGTQVSERGTVRQPSGSRRLRHAAFARYKSERLGLSRQLWTFNTATHSWHYVGGAWQRCRNNKIICRRETQAIPHWKSSSSDACEVHLARSFQIMSSARLYYYTGWQQCQVHGGRLKGIQQIREAAQRAKLRGETLLSRTRASHL